MKRNILLTGATGGLGRHIASALAEAGHNLVLTARSLPEEDLPAGTGIHFLPCDLSVPEEIKRLAHGAGEIFGPIEVLINAAGVSESAMSWKISYEQWSRTMAVNLSAPFLLSAALLPHMRDARFGRIVNLSSIVAFRAVPGTSSYAASKAGLEGWVKAMAVENAARGITVNNLALGYFDAGMLYDIPEDIRKAILTDIPARRFGNPETVSSLILWLISEEAGYCTGQTIHLNGGLYT